MTDGNVNRSDAAAAAASRAASLFDAAEWYAQTVHLTSDPAPLDVGERLDALATLLYEAAREYGTITWMGINDDCRDAELALRRRRVDDGGDRASSLLDLRCDLKRLEQRVEAKLRTRGLAVQHITPESPYYRCFRWGQRVPVLIRWQ
jgi:hypothetical protein